MITRLIMVGALLAASVAYFLSSRSSPNHGPYVQGRNGTALFITNSEHGLSNVHFATASALLENYPDIEVHYASFPSVRSKAERISSFARAKTPTATAITFHEIKRMTFVQALVLSAKSFSTPPGSAGIAEFAHDFQSWISPWPVEDHMEIFEDLNALIDEVDPAVVVLDTWFKPAVDATRQKNRQHAFITPNILVENFIAHQPLWKMFWKYPATLSGFGFPIPLRHIPENIYLNMRFIYSAMFTPAMSEKKAKLRELGIVDPINFFGNHRDDVPWITQQTDGASVPVDVIPPNVTCAGPIVLSGASAAEQDPELAAWLKRAPTVLINLGSNVAYDEHQAAAMSVAIAELLAMSELQVIWKFNKNGGYSDQVLSPLREYLTEDRLRMPTWLTADPSSLLETGDIVASIHHGGSNCYHEAIASGLVQVILPLWADLYGYAALVESIGVGTWGCRSTSPTWSSECLSAAFLKVLDGGADSMAFRQKAKQLGDQVQAGEKGRDIAARVIAKLAYVATAPSNDFTAT